MTKLLIVEDNEGLREQMKWALSEEFQVYEAGTKNAAIEMFAKERPPVICLDMGLDNHPEGGLEVIDRLVSLERNVKIVVVTSSTSKTLGPKAIELGAFDYLTKPVRIDELKVLLARASRMASYEKPADMSYDAGLAEDTDFPMIGRSDVMKQIFNHIRRLSKTDVNVLITGESGTGKELCARAIHYHSSRKNESFVPINCGAIPETLLESELFGYVKGAFTGANSDKMGLIESANGGTLFLDEIGDMPATLQVKLLRFLEDQKLQRIGETDFRTLNVRIIAATNKNQQSDENDEILRSDLYFRLSEFEIHLPPLRDRKRDIYLIAHSIIERNRERFNMPKLRVSPRVEKILTIYSWPGNIRELENKLNRASITCQNQTIEVEDLDLSETSFTDLTLKEARQIFERNFILNALRVAKGNVSLASKNIAVTRPTFYELMRKNNIVFHKK